MAEGGEREAGAMVEVTEAERGGREGRGKEVGASIREDAGALGGVPGDSGVREVTGREGGKAEGSGRGAREKGAPEGAAGTAATNSAATEAAGAGEGAGEGAEAASANWEAGGAA